MLFSSLTQVFTGKDLVRMYARIISAIRAVDANHMVILEGGNFAMDFAMFTAPADSNMAYSFHMYDLSNSDAASLAARASHLAQYTSFAKAQNVPLWAGEFGDVDATVTAGTVSLFKNPANLVSGWAYWAWKKTGPNCFPLANPFFPGVDPYLNAIPLTSKNWNAFLTWLCGWTAMPTGTEAQQAATDFESTFLWANNVPNLTMYSALK
jgi:hypothetical protein